VEEVAQAQACGSGGPGGVGTGFSLWGGGAGFSLWWKSWRRLQPVVEVVAQEVVGAGFSLW